MRQDQTCESQPPQLLSDAEDDVRRSPTLKGLDYRARMLEIQVFGLPATHLDAMETAGYVPPTNEVMDWRLRMLETMAASQKSGN